jgi:hypothetical protein
LPPLRQTKALVAAHLNMQPETLSRALVMLRRIGVETRRCNVSMPNISKLRRVRQGDEL